jgi:hypothetical protein
MREPEVFSKEYVPSRNLSSLTSFEYLSCTTLSVLMHVFILFLSLLITLQKSSASSRSRIASLYISCVFSVVPDTLEVFGKLNVEIILSVARAHG